MPIRIHTAPPAPAPRAGERIAKLLARAGVASRREVERMIADGRVARDGVVIDTPATLLLSLAGITVDGQPVAAPAAARLFAYHKPVGLLVTERDPAGRPTIYDRLPAELPRVVPVGRLDLATEGLLLLTTDGGLKRQLELPATGVERTYRARAYGPVSQAQLEELIHGIEIDGVRYGAIDANLERRTGANGWIELTLTEGKNREVRRVLEHLGLEISRLIRTRYGPFVLGELKPGEVGEIRQHDLEGFRKTLKVGRAGEPMISVAAEPLAKVPAAVPGGQPAPDRRRPRSSPARRDGGETGPPAAARADRGDRSARPMPAAGCDSRSERSTGGAAGVRSGDRSRPVAPRDERPRAFGDRTRAVAKARGEARSDDRQQGRGDGREARPSRPHPDDRSGPARAAKDGTRSRVADGDATGSDRSGRRPPRAERSATLSSAPPRPGGSRPGTPRSPDGDRPTRGPAGGRGKPAASLRRPTGPRGKR